MVVLSDQIVVARKEYRCDATARILEVAFYDDFTSEEMRQLDQAEADGGKILVGQSYRRMTYVDGGSFYTYRARPEMDRIAHRNELWWGD